MQPLRGHLIHLIVLDTQLAPLRPFQYCPSSNGVGNSLARCRHYPHRMGVKGHGFLREPEPLLGSQLLGLDN